MTEPRITQYDQLTVEIHPTNQALGEAERFRSLLAEYRRDPRVTRRRLYLETMERVLSRAEVMVVRDASKVTILDEPGRP